MNIGELRNRIEIQNYIRTPNEVGEEVKQWQTYIKLWAKFETSLVKEQVQAGKNSESVVHEIVIRYRNDLDSTMRVVYKGNNYNINHVVNDQEQNIETHLFCTLIEEGVYNE
ncbi:phage head closure protein [Desulfosporosinus lacus]|uniref:Phage head-tail adaptor, putative, SPP1 family n=1 Tax=Desulfosporosinus lacus DSM 15449 TaxID=1121420 RepID=A0A1M5QKK0_9FIRM|nr:phage head closure protein [Desulfosporosinus lacus]SHH14607.1 phage head-tail adaptor, putative, SPP1 family [Desulfosporosinus lacus DSM 15449]